MRSTLIRHPSFPMGTQPFRMNSQKITCSLLRELFNILTNVANSLKERFVPAKP